MKNLLWTKAFMQKGCLSHLGLAACLWWLVVSSAHALTNCTSAPPGLVSWWRGENSTAAAVGGNNGTIAGTGLVTYGPGVVGQAFVFDGTHRDRIDLGNPVNLRLQDFTLEAWVKRSSPTVTSFDVLGADGSVCGDGACIIGYGRGGYILAVANDGRLILSRTDIDGVLSAPLITDVNWHHLAVTKAGTNAVFYVDGQPQATASGVANGPYTFDDATCSCNAAIAIGSRGDARGGTFYGAIDEPAVFNRPLSPGEIQSIYAAGSAGKCPPNSWTNPVSGRWDASANWSFHTLPASNQTVSIANGGYKAVNIDSATVANFAASLTVGNLLVAAPTNALSTLLLNYAGLDTPLKILNDCTIGPNGAIDNFSSSFEVDGNDGGQLLVNGGTFNQAGGLTVVNAPVVVRSGSLNATNATMNLGPLQIGAGYPHSGAVNQSGGTILASDILINYGTYSLLTNGTLYALNGTYVTNEASFIQNGGTNYGDVRLGYNTSYQMTGGLLRGTNIYAVTFGTFGQNGGTVEVQNLSIQGDSIFSIFPSYVLTTGRLHCATLSIAGNNGGFRQFGGTLFLTNGLNLFDASGAADTFALFGGNAFMPSLVVSNGGEYLQYGGSNQVAGDITVFNDGLAIYGGRLSSANMGIAESGRVYQDRGTNEISGVLSIVGGYTVVEGLLSVGGIYTRGNLVISFLNSDGTATPAILNNTGLINFGGALYVSSSQNSMGQLGLSANGTINLGTSPLTLRFADSHALNWDSSSTLTIEGWNGSSYGNGSHQVYFGSNAAGLTSQQLARIKFSISGGLYSARILATGEVVPEILAASRSGKMLTLTWGPGWTLQSSTNAAGPFQDIPGAGSPRTVSMDKPREFFRLRQ